MDERVIVEQKLIQVKKKIIEEKKIIKLLQENRNVLLYEKEEVKLNKDVI